MSDEHEGQVVVRELERLRKGVRRLNVLIAAILFALAALVLWLLFVMAR
jgi:hypothetical protein